MAKKNKRKLKNKNIIILIILFILIIFLIKNIFSNKNKFIGSWTTDGVTIYEFKKDNTGTLKVSLTEYNFDYKVEKNKIFIDFENEKSHDSEYIYSFQGDKLVLEGANGKFTFIKN